MKFIVFFACVAAVASAEQARVDSRVFGIIGAILDILRPVPALVDESVGNDKPIEPIHVGPAIIDGFEPIHVGPAIIDGFEPIHVGPAIVEGFEPISVGPAIIDQMPIAPSPVMPVPVYPSPVYPVPVLPYFSSPLVQLIVNVKSGSAVAGNPVSIESMPDIIASPAIVDPEVAIAPEIIASPAIVDPEIAGLPEIIASPVIVSPEVALELENVVSPVVVSDI